MAGGKPVVQLADDPWLDASFLDSEMFRETARGALLMGESGRAAMQRADTADVLTGSDLRLSAGCTANRIAVAGHPRR
jgi:hypothetical protein